MAKLIYGYFSRGTKKADGTSPFPTSPDASPMARATWKPLRKRETPCARMWRLFSHKESSPPHPQASRARRIRSLSTSFSRPAQVTCFPGRMFPQQKPHVS